jgi:hypothetical protein
MFIMMTETEVTVVKYVDCKSDANNNVANSMDIMLKI